MNQRGKRKLQAGVFVTACLVFLAILVTALGRFAWLVTPQTDPKIQIAAAFQASVTRELSKGKERNSPARVGSPKEVEDDHPGNPVHSVREWGDNNRDFRQSPLLDGKVRDGTLPQVEDRLPKNPLVVVPPEQNGPYGGTWTRFGDGPQDVGILDDRLAYDGLVRWDPMGREVIPNLATHWNVEDEGRQYTFKIREGVRWSDGKPFTGEDILFWYEHCLLNEDLTPIIPLDFMGEREVMKVRLLDLFTVQFRFPEPKGLFLQKMASGRSYEICAYPEHHMKQFHIDFVSAEELEARALTKGFDLWSKLFRDEWEWRSTTTPRLWPWLMLEPPPSNPIQLERNPYYWKVDPDGNQLPYIDWVTFEIFDKETINFKAINGEIGMQSRHLEFRNYSLFLEHQKKGGYRVLKWIDGSGGPAALLPNLNHRDPEMRKLLENKFFRIALSHAIDRNAINALGYFGVGEPRQISPPRSSEYYWETFSKSYTTFDPSRANRMLDDLGMKRASQGGYRLLPDGRPVTLQIETTNQRSRELEIVASNWRDIGIRAEVKELARQLWTERKRALTFDVAVWGGAAGQMPLLDPKWFLPVDTNNCNAPDYGRGYMTGGAGGQVPPPNIKVVMDLWSQIEKTVDAVEQKALFRQILEHNLENLWVIGMVGEHPSIVVVKDNFRNVPEVAVQSWMFRTPGNTAPECYAIENAGNREL
ncbi:MAG: ABC transporter substrate-binding protein [Candidatus Latescibacterota bacterium]|nr:ABC transporter substrate-binding protein [Candidatus Latescibacterota bacterium]